MKKFKHKTLWWDAKETEHEMENYYWVFKIWKKIGTPVFKELIEADSNREEVVEKDWIDDAITDYDVSEYNTYKRKENLRQAIEKHAPKERKFTREDIDNWYNSASYIWTRGYIEWFLRGHWLLEE